MQSHSFTAEGGKHLLIIQGNKSDTNYIVCGKSGEYGQSNLPIDMDLYDHIESVKLRGKHLLLFCLVSLPTLFPHFLINFGPIQIMKQCGYMQMPMERVIAFY